MKTAEAKTSSSALHQKAYKPFFGKGGDAMLSGEGPAKQSFFSQAAQAAAAGAPIQAKLTVGKPNDHYEKEADNMADKVVQRLSKGDISRSSNPAQIDRCAQCDAEEAEEKKEEKVQKKEKKSSPEELNKLHRKAIFESDAETPVQKKSKQESPAPKVNKSAPVNVTITPVSSITPVQAKCSACEKEKLQMQEGESEEMEKLQRKPIFDTGADEDSTIQRRCRECDEGDKVLMKPIAGIQRSDSDQTPNADGSRNSILAAAKGELGKVQARLNDGTGKRVGADRLLEYFHIAAPDVWQDSIIETAGAKMPSWCGIFSVWAHKKAGKNIGNWQMGKGVSAFGTLTQTDSPQPGDIGYIDQPNQHHAVVKEVAGDTIHTIDGNSGINSEVIENAKPRSAYSGFLTAFGGGSSSGSVQAKGEAAAQNHIGGDNTASDSVESRITNTRGKGSTLPSDTRQDMEQSFGADFSNVRIHTDSTASQLSNDLQAHAFTQGSDIYFNSGMYDTGSDSGKRLLAHELTHVVQQGHAPDQVQRYSWDEFVDDVSDVADSAEEAIEDGAEAIAETAEDVKDFVVETGTGAIEVVTDAASAALDWLKTTAGEAAQALVEHLGGTLTITAAGIEITFGRNCFMDAHEYKPKIKGWSKEKLWYVAAFPVGGDLLLTGQLGFKINIDPQIQIQVGPACLEGFHLLINPLTNNYDISGSISTSIGVALGAEIRGGVKGQLGLTAVFPFPPFIATAPLVGLEGGLAGLVRGIYLRRQTIGGALTYSGGTITASGSSLDEIGLGYDLYAGAYGQLDILGEKVCRLYWEPLEKHGNIAYGLGLSGDVSIVPGSPTTITPNLNDPTLDPVPFDSLDSILDRKGMSDDCPIKDKICEVLKALKLLPSQNGGKWDWAATGTGGTYGPGPILPGPNVVYQRNPGIPSGASCRGACGPDCLTCDHHPVYTATDTKTGETWEYTNYEACKSNDGCREHDAAFDWAADAKGEKGKFAIIYPWHMAANIECTCNNVAGNCLAWIAGLPPYDMDLNFADTATRVGSGGGGIKPVPNIVHSTNPIGEIGPDFYHYSKNKPSGSFGKGGERWTDYLTNCQAEAEAATGVGGHRYITVLSNAVVDKYIDRTRFTVRRFTSVIHGVLTFCYHYRNHTEIPETDYATTDLDIFTPDCQAGTGPSSATGNEEEDLAKCDRGELPPDYCEVLHNRVIERFGNRERDLNLNPDTDVDEGRTRPDDAPIMSSFRRMYNRLDSWDIYMKNKHPDWYTEFDTRFKVKDKKILWMDELKKRTKTYKSRFRDARTQDTAELRRRFLEADLTEIQGWISALNLEIANWYKAKTGSTEDVNTIIERVHAEGTEMWRAAWRAAILAVNRILSRLWPNAKARIIGWVADQRNLHPGKDLDGDIGELDYVGSLATGYKGAPKQFARFNPDKFDVDGNVEAPPLEKFAVNIRGIVPDRQRIFAVAQDTGITPLIAFCHDAQRELVSVPGYDATDEFDVVIQANNTASQQRSEDATTRIYKLRSKLGSARYDQMVTELRTAGLLVDVDNSWQVKPQLSFAEQVQLNAILRRYE